MHNISSPWMWDSSDKNKFANFVLVDTLRLPHNLIIIKHVTKILLTLHNLMDKVWEVDIRILGQSAIDAMDLKHHEFTKVDLLPHDQKTQQFETLLNNTVLFLSWNPVWTADFISMTIHRAKIFDREVFPLIAKTTNENQNRVIQICMSLVLGISTIWCVESLIHHGWGSLIDLISNSNCRVQIPMIWEKLSNQDGREGRNIRHCSSPTHAIDEVHDRVERRNVHMNDSLRTKPSETETTVSYKRIIGDEPIWSHETCLLMGTMFLKSFIFKIRPVRHEGGPYMYST